MSFREDIAQGDVVRCDRYARQQLVRPMWLYARRVGREGDWWCDALDIGSSGTDPDGIFLDADDTFDIIPPDEVPDHVQAALMKANLT